MADSNRYLIKSVERAALILDLFATERPKWTEQEIVEATGLTRGTVYRFVQTLIHLGYVVEDSTGKLRPGPRVLSLGQAALRSLEIREIALPILERVREDLSCTVNMTVPDLPEIVYVVRLRGPGLLDTRLQVGSRIPAYATSMGRAMLACLSDTEARAVLDASTLTELTENTVTEPDALLEVIRGVRAAGYAVNDQELAHGLRGVGTAICVPDGRPIAAINVAFTRVFKPSEVEKVIAPRLQAAAEEIKSHVTWHSQSS